MAGSLFSLQQTSLAAWDSREVAALIAHIGAVVIHIDAPLSYITRSFCILEAYGAIAGNARVDMLYALARRAHIRTCQHTHGLCRAPCSRASFPSLMPSLRAAHGRLPDFPLCSTTPCRSVFSQRRHTKVATRTAQTREPADKAQIDQFIEDSVGFELMDAKMTGLLGDAIANNEQRHMLRLAIGIALLTVLVYLIIVGPVSFIQGLINRVHTTIAALPPSAPSTPPPPTPPPFAPAMPPEVGSMWAALGTDGNAVLLIVQWTVIGVSILCVLLLFCRPLSYFCRAYRPLLLAMKTFETAPLTLKTVDTASVGGPSGSTTGGTVGDQTPLTAGLKYSHL
jgi:hypothetical protein